MKLHKDSHLDHGLNESQIAFIVGRFSDRSAFFKETIELPEELGSVPCALYGPAVGLPPVPEAEVVLRARGDREWKSRVIEVAYPRTSRKVTVIAGPHEDEACVLYTAYGGPEAPQEVGDLEQQWEREAAKPRTEETCKAMDAIKAKLDISRAFWREHALIEVVDTKEG